MTISHVICATPGYLEHYGTPQTPQDLREHSCISLGETPADSRWKFRRGGKRKRSRPTAATPPTIPPCASMP
jgi:hypothetical protein